MKVFLKGSRRSSGVQEGPDYRYKYTIRSIGKKQAILDRIFNTTEEGNRHIRYGRRGSTHYLHNAGQISSWREAHPGQDLPYYYNESWSDIFVPAGDGNWDSEENYHWS